MKLTIDEKVLLIEWFMGWEEFSPAAVSKLREGGGFFSVND